MSPIVSAMLAVLADRAAIAHLDFTPEEENEL